MRPDDIQPIADPIVYTNGIWCKQSEATVPFMDSGFWHGDGLFETVRAVNGVIFRPNKHLARMKQGMGVLRIDFPMPEEKIIELLGEIIKRNNTEDATLRLMVTRGTVNGAPWKFDGSTNLYIGFRYAVPLPPLPLKLVFFNEADYPIGRMYPALKSMTYLANNLALRDASALGAFEPLFINHEGIITECAVRNIFFIKGNTVRTPDLSLGILPGVTRDLVLDLARDEGLEIDTSPIYREDANEMDEAFISSTGIGVCPATWDGFPGSDYAITKKLSAAAHETLIRETAK